MNSTPTNVRNLARRLVAFKTPARKVSPNKEGAGVLVCEKMRSQLATLMGNGGLQALLARTLALSCAEVPALRALKVNEEGAVRGWEELHAQLDPEQLTECEVVLMAQLLGLLVAFIGENLTLRLVREVWPKLPPRDSDFLKGDKNEKAN